MQLSGLKETHNNPDTILLEPLLLTHVLLNDEHNVQCRLPTQQQFMISLKMSNQIIIQLLLFLFTFHTSRVTSVLE